MRCGNLVASARSGPDRRSAVWSAPVILGGSEMPATRGYGRPGTEIALLVAVLKYASLVSRPMRGDVADPVNLSCNELRILLALSGEGDSAGHHLAELMGMHAMNVSRALASLRRMGLVEPVPDRKNRRRRPFRISARGAAACAALQPYIARVAQFLFAPLSADERASLARIVAKLDEQVLRWQPREQRPHVRRA